MIQLNLGEKIHAPKQKEQPVREEPQVAKEKEVEKPIKEEQDLEK